MQVTIENLNACLDGSKQYETPLFQRPFAWKQEHWQRLWEDLQSYCDTVYVGGKTKHFMGAIVVQRRTGGGAISHYWTIDGQQRLTTFSILLCALRDLNENNDEISREVLGYLTNHKRPKTASDYLKLALGEQDRDFFAAIALKKFLDSNSAESQIFQCYEFFKKKLEEARDDEDFDVERFYRIVRDAPQIVLIDLDEADDPYMIFESLNFKGAPLKSVDLIRNFVLMKFQDAEEQKRIYAELWKPIENELGNAAEDFFFHYVRKETAQTTTKSRVYEDFKRIFDSLSGKEAYKKLVEIRKNAAWYREFLSPETLTNREVARELDALKTFKCQVVYPLLLRLKERCQKCGVELNAKAGEYVRFLRVLNSFIMRRAICGGQTVVMNNLVTSLLRGLDDVEPPFDRWLEFYLVSQSGRSYWPDDDAFRAGIKKTKTKNYDSERTKLFLSAIERKIGGKEAGDVEKATVEHILPQTLNEVWRSDLGPNAEEIRADYLHSFGNLTLTKINAELKNAPYKVKRQEYRNSCFRLNRDVAQKFECWTAEEIDSRADFLADQAIQIWARPDSQIGETTFLTLDDDWTHRRPRRIVGGNWRKSVKFWKDVYCETLLYWKGKYGVELLRESFLNLGYEIETATEFEAENLRAALKITENFYVEGNLSANSIRGRLKKLAASLNVAINDFRIEL